MQLHADSLVDEVRHMAPELLVGGGSFAHWLPHPCDIPPTVRHALLIATQQDATAKCLKDLVMRVGLPAIEPARLASGAREWPGGYTGSVSHKRTTVVAAIAPTDRMTSVGIDIECLDGNGVPSLRGLDAVEQPWSISAAHERVIVFSIKEAAFKALHPVLGHPLGFRDVALSWLPPDAARCRGIARACGVALEVRCSIAVPSWVVSVALWP